MSNSGSINTMMKYYATKHKNKTPVEEMDAFRAIILFIYLFIYLFIFAALKASIF